jgi:hypothetical protein
MYSQHLSWGYFDHPPAIAFLIHLGTHVFSGELGVRLLPVLLGVFNLWLWEKIIGPKNIGSYFLLITSVAIIHLYGILATPDAALLVSVSAYLFVYRKFLDKPDFQTSLLLGLTMAAMLLSKYHGVLVIFFTLLSNFKLLKNKWYWFAGVFGIILLIPHLTWQVQAGFPSLQFHFFQRISRAAYTFDLTTEYLLVQIFFLGPLTGILFFISAYKQKVNSSFERTLKFLFWGTYVFFFLMTFKGKTEAHWTLIATLPALYFGVKYFQNNAVLVKRIAIISVPLLIAMRLLMAVDFGFQKLKDPFKIFFNQERMTIIEDQASGQPVAFMNSYQDASLYSFYASGNGFPLNNIRGRKSQFDLWKSEDLFRGDSVLVIPNYFQNNFDTIQFYNENIPNKWVANFQSFTRLRVKSSTVKLENQTNETANIELVICDALNEDILLEANPEMPVQLVFYVFKNKEIIHEQRLKTLSNTDLNQKLKVTIQMPDTPGKYAGYFAIGSGWLPPTLNGENIEIIIH